MRNHFVAVSLVIAFAHAKKVKCSIHIAELTSQVFVITYLGELGLIIMHKVSHSARMECFKTYFERRFWEMKEEKLSI